MAMAMTMTDIMIDRVMSVAILTSCPAFTASNASNAGICRGLAALGTTDVPSIRTTGGPRTPLSIPAPSHLHCSARTVTPTGGGATSIPSRAGCECCGSPARIPHPGE